MVDWIYKTKRLRKFRGGAWKKYMKDVIKRLLFLYPLSTKEKFSSQSINL